MDHATKARNTHRRIWLRKTITTLLTFRIVWNFAATLAIQVSFALFVADVTLKWTSTLSGFHPVI
jgi:hypothetical protein